jgi:hypothetical protein
MRTQVCLSYLPVNHGILLSFQLQGLTGLHNLPRPLYCKRGVGGKAGFGSRPYSACSSADFISTTYLEYPPSVGSFSFQKLPLKFRELSLSTAKRMLC